jgi:hypothetical protein
LTGKKLGFAFKTSETLRSGEKLFQAARGVLKSWEASRDVAFRRAGRAFPDSAEAFLVDRTFGLVTEAYRAGLRMWLVSASFESMSGRGLLARIPQLHSSLSTIPLGVPRATAADLRWWCSLQLLAIDEVLPRAYPAPKFFVRTKEQGAESLLQPAKAPDPSDLLLMDLVFLDEVGWLFGPSDPETPFDLDLLLPALAHLYWTWPEGGTKPRPEILDFGHLVHIAWSAMRDLAGRSGTPYPPEPTRIDSERACRSALDQVIAWCWDRERGQTVGPDTTGGSAASAAGASVAEKSTGPGKAKGVPSAGRGDQPLGGRDAGRGRRPAGRKPAPRSWTQGDLNQAIYRYKAERASTYHDLIEGVRKGKPGAKKDARRLFGRNAVADALGVKARAMVTKSPAWRDIAEDLLLSPKTSQRRPLNPRKRIGEEIADEEKAVALGDPVEKAAIRKETVALIRSKMSRKSAEATLRLLELGEISDDSARDILQLAVEQRKDSGRRVHQKP